MTTRELIHDVDDRLERATDNEVLALARAVAERLREDGEDEALRRRAETLGLLVRALDL